MRTLVSDRNHAALMNAYAIVESEITMLGGDLKSLIENKRTIIACESTAVYLRFKAALSYYIQSAGVMGQTVEFSITFLEGSVHHYEVTMTRLGTC